MAAMFRIPFRAAPLLVRYSAPAIAALAVVAQPPPLGIIYWCWRHSNTARCAWRLASWALSLRATRGLNNTNTRNNNGNINNSSGNGHMQEEETHANMPGSNIDSRAQSPVENRHLPSTDKGWTIIVTNAENDISAGRYRTVSDNSDIN